MRYTEFMIGGAQDPTDSDTPNQPSTPAPQADHGKAEPDNLIVAWLKRDGWAIALYIVAAIVMTFPLVRGLTTHLDRTNIDIHQALWQNWWILQVFGGGDSLARTQFLFYPIGFDAAFIPRRWPGVFSWSILEPLLGPIGAHNIQSLLSLIASGYGVYLLVVYLTKNRAGAWFAGAFYAFYPNHVWDVLQQPNTGNIHYIPFAILLLIIALDRVIDESAPRKRLEPADVGLLIAAAFLLSLNAYVNLKIYVFAGLTGAGYVGLRMLVEGFWKRRSFWLAMGLYSAATLLIALPIYLPYFTTTWLDEALNQWTITEGVDILAYFSHGPDTLFFVSPAIERMFGLHYTFWYVYKGSFYLGLSAMLIAAVGLVGMIVKGSQRRWLIWWVLAIFFWLMSLGVMWTFDRQPVDFTWTPYYFLQSNPIFQALRESHRFSLVLILPMAVIIGYGWQVLWDWLKRWAAGPAIATGLTVVFSLVLLLETSQAPLPVREIPVSAFYQDERFVEGGVIDLPMGRQPAKYYMYLQMTHNQPIVEGMSARTPPDAYSYIDQNALLSTWFEWQGPNCTRSAEYEAAAQQLLDDGFEFVFLHQHGRNWTPNTDEQWETLRSFFRSVPPLHLDPLIEVYRVEDVMNHLPCE
ncbi:MAG: YfhO family protein [Chloroflexi bacterium]|nr:YfhO family protein [Chloroflexota bacterium]